MDLESIRQAASALDGVVRRTPSIACDALDETAEASVILKCENLQRTGSFKFRGAYYALSRVSDEERSRGVLTFSSGNHAQALALAGRLLGAPVTVVMPTDAPAVKREATIGYGAEVVLYDREETSRETLGARIAKERELTVIPPYDHPDVVAGQGTAALELIEDVGPLDRLLVCLGGGGLLSGCAIVTKSLAPSCRVIGVEPALADDGARSFRSKELHRVHNPPTIADGARTPSLGAVTFPLVLRWVDDVVTVTEEAILFATRFLWERAKLVVEPTGALAVAAILDRVVDVRGERVGAIVSGGNAEIECLVAHWSSRSFV